MADFRASPAYQRAKQRLGRKTGGPVWRVINALSIDKQFASEDTRKELQALAFESDKEYRDASFALKERAGDIDFGLRKEAFEDREREDLIASGIGLGQVAAESYYGGTREDLEMAILKKKLDFMRKYEV